MINKEKLQGCIPEIIELSEWLDNFAKQKGTELIVSSGYRQIAENIKAGGSPKSLHLTGRAIDFYLKDSNIFKWVSELFVNFLNDKDVFEGLTEFEVCRAINGINHIHLAYGLDKGKRSFTGTYNR